MAQTDQKEAALTPMDFLKRIQGAPSQNEIDAWKMQAPGGRLRVFTPDGGKRVFILRALSGLEMEAMSKAIPQNAVNPDLEMQIHASVKGVIWTNCTQDGQVDEMFYRKSPAGLATSMFSLISKLSDFMDPEALEAFSADL